MESLERVFAWVRGPVEVGNYESGDPGQFKDVVLSSLEVLGVGTKKRCLGLFASEGESWERVKAGGRIDREGVYIWDGTGVKCW